jgi:hypothetical protein
MNEATILIVFGGVGTCGFLYVVYYLHELHNTMNSRLDELLIATRSLARAEGFKAGQKDSADSLEAIRKAGENVRG